MATYMYDKNWMKTLIIVHFLIYYKNKRYCFVKPREPNQKDKKKHSNHSLKRRKNKTKN